jgi:hypothetical protein
MSDASNRLVTSLREASEAIAAAKVPAKLQEIAFAKSIDHLLGTPTHGVQTPGRQAAGTGHQTTSKGAAQGGGLGKIAAKLKVSDEFIERVYAVEGEAVHLGVARKSLADSRKAATQEVAYLIAAGRQAAGIEDSTLASVIRDICEEVGVLDGNNYAAAIAELQGLGFLIKGSGKGRQLKINGVGYDKASEIVTRVASEAGK